MTMSNSILTRVMLLTVKQVAELLQVSRSTVYNMMDRGDLLTLKIGGSRRIPKELFLAYVHDRFKEGMEEARAKLEEGGTEATDEQE